MSCWALHADNRSWNLTHCPGTTVGQLLCLACSIFSVSVLLHCHLPGCVRTVFLTNIICTWDRHPMTCFLLCTGKGGAPACSVAARGCSLVISTAFLISAPPPERNGCTAPAQHAALSLNPAEQDEGLWSSGQVPQSCPPGRLLSRCAICLFLLGPHGKCIVSELYDS